MREISSAARCTPTSCPMASFSCSCSCGRQREDVSLAGGDRRRERGRRRRQHVQGRLLGRAAPVEFLDLALGGEDAARGGARAARDLASAAEHVAIARDDGRARRRRCTGGLLERVGHPRVADGVADRRPVGAADPQQAPERLASLGRGPALRRRQGADHHEAASAQLALAQHIQPPPRLVVRRHEHRLQQIAQARFGKTLGRGIRFHRIHDRPVMADPERGVGQDGLRRVGVALAGGLEFLERREASREPGKLTLARALFVGPPLALDARRGQVGVACRPGGTGGLDGPLRRAQGLAGDLARPRRHARSRPGCRPPRHRGARSRPRVARAPRAPDR